MLPLHLARPLSSPPCECAGRGSCHWTLLVPRYTGSAGSKCRRSTVRPRHLADRDSWFFMHAPRNRIQPCPSAGLRCVAARVRARPAVIGPRASASGSTRVGELCAARRAESLTVGSLSTLSGMLVRYRWARLRLATSGVAATVGSGVPSSPLGGARQRTLVR